MKQNIAAIVLAAGRGTRLNCVKESKAMKTLAGKPMIYYTVRLLSELGFKKKQIYIVVGFAKNGVRSFLGKEYNYVLQGKLAGTADALKKAIKKLDTKVSEMFVLQADDSAFYPSREVERLINDHFLMKNDMSFLTVEKDNPAVARVLRDRFGNLTGIVEANNCSRRMLKVREINAALYVIKKSFADFLLPQIKPNKISSEYHLPDLIILGLKQGYKVRALKASDNDFFQGVNTKKELEEADLLMKKKLGILQ